MLQFSTVYEIISFFKKSILSNSIRFYRGNIAKSVFIKLVNAYPNLWKDLGFVQVPESSWLRILLKND